MPQPFAFEPGTCYELDGVGYAIVSPLAEGQLVVRDLLTQGKHAVLLKELRQRWKEGRLRFALEGPRLRQEPGHPLKTRYVFTDLSFLPRAVQYETWVRYTIIRPLLDLSTKERPVAVRSRVAAVIAAYLEWVIPHDQEAVLTRLGGNEWWRQHGLEAPPLPAQDMLALMEQARQERIALHLFGTPWIGVSARSVYRWMQHFEASRGEIRSLVPACAERGPKTSRLAPRVQEILHQAVEETYETEERPSVQKVIAVFHGKLLKANQGLSPAQQLKMPGKNTIYRAIARLDPEEVDSARFGQVYATRQHHQVEQGPRPTRPNQRWEIDHSPLDLLVIDEADWLPIGRPIFTTVLDRFSRYPPGFSISFEPASYLTVMDALFYAIQEKDQVKPLLGLQHEYQAYGVPEVLACDNGKEFRTPDLELACAELGMELDWMPRRTPWFKGAVERWYRTANTELIHHTPGTTFSHFLERGDYDSRTHACITLEGLWFLLHHWIVDIYAQTWRRGGRGSFRPKSQGVPAKLWERALEENFVPRLPPSREELLVLLGRTEERVLTPTGIEFEGLFYNGHQLAPLRHRLNHSQDTTTQPHTKKAATPVQFKYYPADISRIWVLDPFSKTYLEVEAVDQEYTQHLSLWKHGVIKRYVREEMKRDVDEASLAEAKYRLHQLVREEFRLVKHLQTRKRMARFMGSQVSRLLRGLPDFQDSPDSGYLLPEAAQFVETPSHPPLLPAPGGGSGTVLPPMAAHLAAPLPALVPGVTLVTEGETPDPTCLPLPASAATTPVVPAEPVPTKHPGRPRNTDQQAQPAQEAPLPCASPEFDLEHLASFGIEVSYTRPRPA
jgi:putative transposase